MSAESKPEGAHLFVQWKGTSLCADARCACGAIDHVCHEEFAYFFRCSRCGTIYETAWHVSLHPVGEVPPGATVPIEFGGGS